MGHDVIEVSDKQNQTKDPCERNQGDEVAVVGETHTSAGEVAMVVESQYAYVTPWNIKEGSKQCEGFD